MKNKIKTTLIVSVIGIGIAMIFYALLIPNVTAINRFESIPEKPDDFDAYVRDIWKGSYVELCDMDEGYWKQPEFYGSSWENAKNSFYDNPDYSKWGVYGQGNMPREIGYTFENFKKGDEFELCSFFHNGFGVWTYQGFKLVPIENEYFDIEITPNELTVTPTFPVFEDGWTRKIKIKIIAKEDMPIGNYIVGFNTVEPNADYSRQETKKTLELTIDKELYKEECNRFIDEEKCNYLINNREKKYVNGGSYQTSTPSLKIVVVIK